MAFMKQDVQFFTAWSVDTTHGTEIIPTAVCAHKPGPDDIGGRAYDEPEKVTGWFCRLSAPGYLDCTDWSGPFDTKEKAMDHLTEMYSADNEE